MHNIIFLCSFLRRNISHLKKKMVGPGTGLWNCHDTFGLDSLPGHGGGWAGLGWHRACTESLFDLKCPVGKERMVGKVKTYLLDVVGQLLSAETKPTLQERHCRPRCHSWERTEPWGRAKALGLPFLGPSTTTPQPVPCRAFPGSLCLLEQSSWKTIGSRLKADSWWYHGDALPGLKRKGSPHNVNG